MSQLEPRICGFGPPNSYEVNRHFFIDGQVWVNIWFSWQRSTVLWQSWSDFQHLWSWFSVQVGEDLTRVFWEKLLRRTVQGNIQIISYRSIPGKSLPAFLPKSAFLVQSVWVAPRCRLQVLCGSPLHRKKLNPKKLKITSILFWRQPPNISLLFPQNKICPFLPP